MTYSEKREIVVLKRYYTIRGDGVARINLPAMVRSPRFQNSLARLAGLDIGDKLRADK